MDVRLLQQHFNQLALCVKKKKKKNLETWCVLVYKKKSSLKNHYIFFENTHNLAFALTNTPHREWSKSLVPSLLQQPGSSLSGMSKYMRSDWKETKLKLKSGVSFHTSKGFFTKTKNISFCTWTGLRHANFNLRNKYTGSQRKGVGRSNSSR